MSQIDASHFDTQTAYAAINRIRLDDLRPHIYRTHDGGKTWQEIVKGLPDDGPVNTVREDPERKGLLFCGTETAVFVSFNDGDEWQPLRLDMPATSIRDLVIHDDDIVVGTHGRSFWILDDITPLRQITNSVASSEAFLFKPELAYRVRWNNNTDTPLPPEEPAGQNPPDGAIINYYLSASVSTPITLEIFDSSKKLVRRFSSADKPGPLDTTQLEHTDVLDPSSTGSFEGRGNATVRVGYALAVAGSLRRLFRRRSHHPRHTAHADRSMGIAREIHCAADGERTHVHTTVGYQNGSEG